jgi:hypothetical protein
VGPGVAAVEGKGRETIAGVLNGVAFHVGHGIIIVRLA